MRTLFATSHVLLLALCLVTFGFPNKALAQDVAQSNAPQRAPLITQVLDESQLTRLTGNTHPLARPEYDLGTAPATLPMERMLLVLKRSPEQESALRQMLDDQQDRSSPNYHKWLSPEEFGRQFGPTDADMQTITLWLESHGFQVGTTKGRTVLEFSGSSSQVQEAFHTTIHKYIVNGEQHWANSSDPSIPTALAPAVAGVLTLHDFRKKPQYIISKEHGVITPGEVPQITFTNGAHGMSPGDFTVIYNVNPLYSAINGSGVTIAVVARSEIDMGDFSDFQNLLGISSRTPQTIVNGPDPGDTLNGDDFEGTLDLTWSQAIAPAATVDYVVSANTDTTDGVDLSSLFIIENNLSHIMTVSFGSCEAYQTDSDLTGTTALAEQGAAQGISIFVASGDAGAEGCDSPNAETVATGPISVNHLASTPFTTAVGGTVFNENGQSATYWNTSNTGGTNGEGAYSAKSYIPQNVWNDSCLSSSCGQNANIAAGGGGKSTGNAGINGTFTGYTKPSWQANVTGIPSTNNRYVPDVSLTASGHDGYLLCYGRLCGTQGEIYLVGGTSASTPSFAGIMALVDQKMGERQGLANYVLYPLAAAGNSNLSKCNGSSTTLPQSTCIFQDVTVGNNDVPGEAGYPSGPYNSTTGYDPASGLGSVNVNNLVTNWANSTFRATTTTLGLTPTTVTHGQSVNVTIGVTASTGTPTGDVSLIAHTGSIPPNETSADGFTLTPGGTFLGTTNMLPGGSYNVTAHYEGIYSTAFFGGSDSASPGVAVVVSPEGSTTTMTADTFDPSTGNFVPLPAASNIPYGDLVYLHAYVQGQSGFGTPTGSVSFSENSRPDLGNPYQLASDGSAATPYGIFSLPGGATSISATYSSDASFNGSTSSPFTFTIVPAQTSLTVTPSPNSVPVGTAVTLTANFTLGTTILPSFGNPPTGTVTFYSGGTSLGTASAFGSSGNGNLQSGAFDPATGAAILSTTALPQGQDSITAVYSGDSNYAASPTSPVATVNVTGPDFSIDQPSPISVGQGQQSSPVTLTVTPVGSFTGTVTFSCSSGLPAETSCGFNPSSVTGSGSTQLTFQTAALGQSRSVIRHGFGVISMILLPLLGLCLIGIPAVRRRGVLALLMVGALIAMLPSCSGGGSSNGGGPPNPQPSISSLSPTSVAAGSQQPTLLVNGSNFVFSSTVAFNNTLRQSNYVSATQLSVQLQNSDVAVTGTFPVTVTNPSPGGGTSGALNFAVVNGTPTGTFYVTVSATSGTTTHTTVIALTVQ